MSKPFNIPPVIFSSPENLINLPQHRRSAAATAPFQHQHQHQTNNLPFMSFNLGSTTASTSSPAQTFTNTSTRRSSNSFQADELPLLEELGINTRQIFLKTTAILNPFKINANLHADPDLSGPFILLMTFGLFQLLAGKFHFGILLGWVTLASLFLYGVFNMLAGRNGNLDVYRCMSLIGYGMLPIVIFSGVSLFLPKVGGGVVLGLGAVFALWSTWICTSLLVEVASCGYQHRWLVAYPCFLIYMMFSLLVIY